MGATPRRLVAKFYRSRDGMEPVDAFIEQLPIPHRVALDRQIDRVNSLDELTPHLTYPHSSQIDGELRELRCHYGNTHYRILYRRSEQFVVLLHIFRKDTAKVPPREEKIAQQRWNDFEARMNAERRSPPSAAGRKAPRKRPHLTGTYPI